MIDRFIYNCFAKLDDMLSWVETHCVKLTSWLWQSRVKLLKKKRRKRK
jgi:hypothetical protein